MPSHCRASSTRLNHHAMHARLAHNQPERGYQYGIVAVEGVSKLINEATLLTNYKLQKLSLTFYEFASTG